MKKTIGCVVPTLNSASTIEMTLLSLKSQRDVDVAVVVVDSGSTDGTLEICEKWGIPTSYVEPGNMYRAVNEGLKQFDTNWIAYLNSDDWVYIDTYAALIAHAEAHGGDLAYGNWDYVDECGRFLCSMSAAAPDRLLALLQVSILGFAQQSSIFSKRAYDALGGFDEKYRYAADADFYLRAIRAGLTFSYLDGPPVACFRQHSNQLTHVRASEMAAEIRAICHTPGVSGGLRGGMTLLEWHLQHIPHYLLRILRGSLLSNQVRIPRVSALTK